VLIQSIAVAAALAFAAPSSARAQALPSPYGVEETWASSDKLYHFAVSAAGAGAIYSSARLVGWRRWVAVAVASGVMGAVGFARELDDRHQPDKYFSEKDLLWDAGGIVIGISIPDRCIFRR
jgi:uncharacterized protein YfiM (DUF2279 family)